MDLYIYSSIINWKLNHATFTEAVDKHLNLQMYRRKYLLWALSLGEPIYIHC